MSNKGFTIVKFGQGNYRVGNTENGKATVISWKNNTSIGNALQMLKEIGLEGKKREKAWSDLLEMEKGCFGILEELEKDTAPYMGLTGFRKKTRIEVKAGLGNVIDKRENNGAITVSERYKIFIAGFGGEKNKPVFIITEPLENLNLGSNDLYLRPLRIEPAGLEYFKSIREPEENLLSAICKGRGIATNEGYGHDTQKLSPNEMIDRIAESHQEDPFLFVETQGISETQLDKITEKQWQETLLPDFLNEGWEKDQVLELVYKSDLLELNQQLITPKNAMPYAPHEFVFTNSKTGKTTTAKKTAISVESASTANLMGFSTANEKIEGSLNNQTKVLRIDEIQEEKNEELHSALNTAMENGTCEIRKGKAKTNLNTYATIAWQGNPKLAQAQDIDLAYTEKEEDLFQKFSDCLGKISRNNEAFGGRIGSIVFRIDLKKAERKDGMKLQNIEKNEAVVSAILAKASNTFTKLFLNNEIIEWLNQSLNKSYLNALKQIEAKSKLQAIQEFVNGHRELASRHVRGKALRLAAVDKALNLMQDKIKTKDLLEMADEYLVQVEEQNQKSFGNLVDVSVQTKVRLEYLKAEYEKIGFHFKIILESLKEANKIQPVKDIRLEELKAHFPTGGSMTLSKQEIISRTVKNMGRANKIISKFGVSLAGNSTNPRICLNDEEIFAKIMRFENEEK